jgi:hypothetical protein
MLAPEVQRGIARGDAVKSDHAVTSEIAKELLEQLDSEWEVATCDRERKRVADKRFLIAAGFLCGLREEERRS